MCVILFKYLLWICVCPIYKHNKVNTSNYIFFIHSKCFCPCPHCNLVCISLNRFYIKHSIFPFWLARWLPYFYFLVKPIFQFHFPCWAMRLLQMMANKMLQSKIQINWIWLHVIYFVEMMKKKTQLYHIINNMYVCICIYSTHICNIINNCIGYKII